MTNAVQDNDGDDLDQKHIFEAEAEEVEGCQSCAEADDYCDEGEHDTAAVESNDQNDISATEPFVGKGDDDDIDEDDKAVENSDEDDEDVTDDSDSDFKRIAISEACAALRNRRKFKASQNTCPLCADLRVVLGHLLGFK